MKVRRTDAVNDIMGIDHMVQYVQFITPPPPPTHTHMSSVSGTMTKSAYCTVVLGLRLLMFVYMQTHYGSACRAYSVCVCITDTAVVGTCAACRALLCIHTRFGVRSIPSHL